MEIMNPLDILAYQYDIVCNGVELSSGEDGEEPRSADYGEGLLAIAGYDKETLKSRFGAL